MIKRSTLSVPQMVALAVPTLVFAGYDLARRNYLAVYLTDDLKLSVDAVGWLILIVNLASIPAELLAGAFGDHGMQAFGRRRQWMVLGTLLVAAGVMALEARGSAWPGLVTGGALVALVVGWALSNVTHGAWALEATGDAVQRARVFGWRSVVGIAGSIGFSALAAAPLGLARSPFLAILLPVAIGACVTHALLIAIVDDRRPVAGGWSAGLLAQPLRLLIADAPNRRLAALFALNGAHTALTATCYQYVVRHGLGLPGWGPTGLLVQSVCAAIGMLLVVRLGGRLSAAGLLRFVLWTNLVLGLALLAVPVRDPAALLVWSGLSGLFSMADFMALRLLLGERIDARARAGTDSLAAAHYAGFHLPFNLCAALAAGALFLGFWLFGFDPNAAPAPARAFAPVMLVPSLAGAVLMLLSLRIVDRVAAGSALALPPADGNDAAPAKS
ncbi:MAG: MFS transporter [Sphingomonadales bacterium]|jgi:Na+/melibiose symporter-like transporter